MNEPIGRLLAVGDPIHCTFYCCTVRIVVLDAKRIDQSWSTYSLSRRSKWRHWTRSPRRSSGSRSSFPCRQSGTMRRLQLCWGSAKGLRNSFWYGRERRCVPRWKEGEGNMTREEFSEALLRFGGDFARWPARRGQEGEAAHWERSTRGEDVRGLIGLRTQRRRCG